ncbi:MAG TPA: CPBP family intramembrane metalloprotease [Candidatus Avipropionibacterium avicola]|uniref:CPBP family intramembrane metalloprotease n=1 Tax=Candidatus Avipropionibacterium avicola TaxID=2840701 RepID=A0A9D1KL87_9ACTN|nr:CPBP family intramembrane metalloprotease [Candidatus Avipropionibacterium avicola]
MSTTVEGTQHDTTDPDRRVPDRRGPRLGNGPWGIALRLLVAPIIMFGANFAVLPLWQLPAMARIAADTSEAGAIRAMVARMATWVLVGIVMVGLTALWLRLVERRSLRQTGVVVNRRGLALLLAGTGLAVAGVLAGVLLVRVVAGPEALGGPTSFEGIPLGLLIAYVVVRSFVLQGIGEEVIFRGWLMDTLRARPLVALVVATLGFTVPHLLSGGGQSGWVDLVTYLAMPFGFGLLAGALVLLTRSVLPAIGIHGGFHVGNAVATGVFGADLISSSVWLVTGGVLALLGVVATLLWWRRTASVAQVSNTHG